MLLRFQYELTEHCSSFSVHAGAVDSLITEPGLLKKGHYSCTGTYAATMYILIVLWRSVVATLGHYKICQNIIYSLLAFSSIYPPRNVSEIKEKITHRKQPRTHILCKLKKKSNISNIFYFPTCGHQPQ